MERPILSPSNPYVGTLRIFPGTLVKVSGRPKPNATRFAINFQTGPSLNPRDDLALHVSPCFTPPKIVRNSLINSAWGLEESWGNGSIMSPHAPFEIMILAEHQAFKIAVNGAHYCEFNHRMPYQQITHLTVDGDVDIDKITIVAQDSQPQPAYQPSAPVPGSLPYPPPHGQSHPMPPNYPLLGPVEPVPNVAPYPGMPSMPSVPGPAPAPASYASGGWDGARAGPYPAPAGPYPTPAGSYPHAAGSYPPPPGGAPAYPMGGPAPAPSGYYQGGYPI